MSDLNPKHRKPFGGLLAAIGVILVAYGLIQMNSFGYRLFGNHKEVVVFFAVGVPCLLVGLWLLLSSSDPKE